MYGVNMREFKLGEHTIGSGRTYFIADIAANHDGDINRAKRLIELAVGAGADAVKFQHHDVTKYVSDYGFRNLGGKFSHQSSWSKSIFEVYKDAEVPLSWTEELKSFCDDRGITFFSTPYDLDMVDYLDKFVPAFKIGSGDVNWLKMLEKVSQKNKPIMVATGASNIAEVQAAVKTVKKHNQNLVLMQCNTNYTAQRENFKYIHLNVLDTYRSMFPDVVLGLSDHTLGHVTVLGAVAKGAQVVEKHFTDDTTRPGPDHPFSMDPETWRAMVDDTRLLEKSLGHGTKEVQDNEKETVVLQRRSIRVTEAVEPGTVLSEDLFEYQRPCPADAISINDATQMLGKTVIKSIDSGDYLRKEHFKW
tara:strand:- start:4127 stop:5209 length:1083 start_codon:yes stop_codon:yes gene_type:complete